MALFLLAHGMEENMTLTAQVTEAPRDFCVHGGEPKASWLGTSSDSRAGGSGRAGGSTPFWDQCPSGGGE